MVTQIDKYDNVNLQVPALDFDYKVIDLEHREHGTVIIFSNPRQSDNVLKIAMKQPIHDKDVWLRINSLSDLEEALAANRYYTIIDLSNGYSISDRIKYALRDNVNKIMRSLQDADRGLQYYKSLGEIINVS